MNILFEERNNFITEMKIETILSIKNKENYYNGMEKAFDDAFNQYARRMSITYASEKKNLIKPVVDRLYTYFTNDEDDFDKCYAECIERSKDILENGRYGIAQKFVNMSFKYLYCYNGALELEHKFDRCYMPLDKYTIKWVKSLNDKSVNKKLNDIKNAWANLEEPLYNEIQELITKTLNARYEYTISYNPNAEENGKCILPTNKLHAEFIIWHQEKINELYKIIKKSEHDFERLGIKMI